MIAKTAHIQQLANSLFKSGNTMTFDQLANNLNSNGFTTEYGTAYTGNRGVAKLVSSVYARLMAQGLTQEAAIVADTFTNAHGNHAY